MASGVFSYEWLGWALEAEDNFFVVCSRPGSFSILFFYYDHDYFITYPWWGFFGSQSVFNKKQTKNKVSVVFEIFSYFFWNNRFKNFICLLRFWGWLLNALTQVLWGVGKWLLESHHGRQIPGLCPDLLNLKLQEEAQEAALLANISVDSIEYQSLRTGWRRKNPSAVFLFNCHIIQIP